MPKSVELTVNATGAVEGARRGHVVMIVDIIDMSTTLEAALDAGATAVYGASPDFNLAPVRVNPEHVGYLAGKKAVELGTEVIVVTEPRVASEEERKNRALQVIKGIERAGAKLVGALPNLGAETAKLTDFKNKVVVAVTHSGGVAFDAALNEGAPAVLTGTICRTMHKRGMAPSRAAAERAIAAAEKHNTGITVVAASSNSLEDILAAEHIVKLILEMGFVDLKLK